MKDHWEDFRRESQRHFSTFHKDYIEPSVHFIEKEKKDADAKYTALEKLHTAMTNKCSDLERYNTLLQEKIESVENEMKSFSQVSMIAKWEKRLHNKSIECTRIQASLDKSIAFTHRLQQENTLLNTRLEKEDLLRQQQLCTTPKPTPNIQSVAQEPTAEALAETVPTVEAALTEEAVHVEATQAPAVEVPPTETETEPPAPAVEEAPAKTEATPAPAVEVPPAETEPPAPAVEVPPAETEPPAPAKTEATPAPQAPAPTSAPDSVDRQTNADVADDDVTTRATDVTYKVKMMKRSRQDAEKTKYMLGTDKVLYEWREGDVAGAVVGHQIEKNGRNVFKFIK